MANGSSPGRGVEEIAQGVSPGLREHNQSKAPKGNAVKDFYSMIQEFCAIHPRGKVHEMRSPWQTKVFPTRTTLARRSRSQSSEPIVIPAQAGIQPRRACCMSVDSRLRGNDCLRDGIEDRPNPRESAYANPSRRCPSGLQSKSEPTNLDQP